MKTIVIKTQEELDALPKSFEEYTVIEIKDTGNAWLHVVAWENSNVEARGNSHVVAWENSNVEARENSNVVARGNSRVVARENSHVVAWGNSHVVAWENSNVVARGNSHVVAWENSNVVARENSNVEAWGNSHVVAWENSNVEARGNSHVVAWENSNVEARENSNVVARGNSNVVAWENSNVVARGNSHVVAFEWSFVLVLSSFVIIKKLLDQTTAVFKGCKISIKEKSDTSHAREVDDTLEISFEEWLRRGYVYADGICKKFVSKEESGETTLFEVEEFLDRTNSFIAKRGDYFAHGKTKEGALIDLEFKIGGRDTSQYNNWKLDEQKPLLEMVLCYRRITGACRSGVEEFLKKIKDKKETYSPKEVIALTKGHFGHNEFEKFGWE